MNKLIPGAFAALSIVALAAPSLAQSYDPQHDALHDDLGAAHENLHQQGIDYGPAHEQWHERANRMHEIDHMNQDAIRTQQQYNGGPGYYTAPGYGTPNVYVQPRWGRRGVRRSINFGW